MNEDLLARWIDDRRSLPEAEVAELARLCDAEAGPVREQLAMDELLARRFSPERAHFEAQVALRVRENRTGDVFVDRTLRRIEGGRRRRGWLAEGAVAALLMAALVAMLTGRRATIPAGARMAPPGLRAEYFKGSQLKGTAVIRIDPVLDHRWEAGREPAPGIGDTFSARWTGKLRAKVTGRHAIRVRNDDGVRLAIAGTRVIDDWNSRKIVYENRGTIDLEAGGVYDVTVEYCDHGDLGVLQVFWSAPGLPEEIIPADCWFQP